MPYGYGSHSEDLSLNDEIKISGDASLNGDLYVKKITTLSSVGYSNDNSEPFTQSIRTYNPVAFALYFNETTQHIIRLHKKAFQLAKTEGVLPLISAR